MISSKQPVLAIDFDGTIVDDKYPAIGKPKLFAFETLKRLQEKGFTLILWTYRSGRSLQEAVEFCRQEGIEFYAVNKSYTEEDYSEDISRKINADVFIDDRNVGGFIGWGAIYRELLGEDEELRQLKSKKKYFFESIFKRDK
ncbi:BT0820 family HAD-type phosphatase [Psychroflexus sp. MES1-P1E]|uniref:BT0820 family HAD-type phosphatase n=1 Tax=Psychroflexus sp. MES1-P1E TaxID=2058320 RepID=UPI000C7B6C77|nr:HAD hydrolase family protein [Psychroflexus sp. MES1-P1E]PKG42273.1 hydrolase [Psychroflexus sp. MES1-P1E]